MRILLSFLLLTVFACHAKCKQSSDSLLMILKAEILKKSHYDHDKELQLKKIKASLAAVSNTNIYGRYEVLGNLIEAYRYYNFDSAHVYTYQLIAISKLLKDQQKIDESKLKLGALQLSWGMYKEAFDCISQLHAKSLPDSNKLRYYELKARALNELASYNSNRFYSANNKTESIKTLDSAVQLSKPGTYDNLKYAGQLFTITDQHDKAIAVLRRLLARNDLTIHQRAMVTNDLSYLVPPAEKEKLLKLAAIYDIRSSTKQTLAIYRLGLRLLNRKELSDAEVLLNEAMAEAKFFDNAIQEKNITEALTQLAAQKLIKSEHQKISTLTILIVVVIFILIGILAMSYIVYDRLKKVRVREAVVKDQNWYLDNINKKLSEDGLIKEEYIGYFFKVISGYIQKLDQIQRYSERKIKTQNYEDLLRLVNEIDIKQERRTLFYTFDSIFLKLFPNFISDFNSLFKPEDQIWPKENELLNTNLRIFALMRLGIKDNQIIANILESTVNTVYTYKNRLKLKSLIPAEEFENKIMEIKL